MKTYGIDYASVDGNKPPAIAMSKADGNTFVYQRASGDGFRIIEDLHFKRDRKAWRQAGIPHGGYLIMCWPTKKKKVPEPETQAQGLIDAVGELLPGELPPCLDIEFGAIKGRVNGVLSARQAIEWCERAFAVLERVYGVVSVYTSHRVWRDDLLGLPSKTLGKCPLWIKTGYLQNYRTPPNLENYIGYTGNPLLTPAPWRENTAGAWLNQIQGDAKGSVGFTSTTDINLFLMMRQGEKSERVKWVQEIVGAKTDGDFGPKTATLVKTFQSGAKLAADGIVGAKSFAALCAAKSVRTLADL